MMKLTLTALLALSTTASAFMVAPPSSTTTTGTALQAVAGAAQSRAEDLELTLKIIMDHAARSTTASKDQFISDMMEQQQQQSASTDDDEAVDISIPYDAAAALAFEQAGSPGDYAAFKTQFEADAVADVMAKNTPAVDIRVPYDAAAKLAFEQAGSQGEYAAFKTQFEADAVAAVKAKNAPAAPAAASSTSSDDIRVPYDAAAKLAYEKAGGQGDYQEFKANYEAEAVAAVMAKQKQQPVAA